MEALCPGDRIDNFTIAAELHQGAMARIYRAREHLSGRNYALKIPFDNILETPLIYYHFQNEERLAAELIHPHIVRFYTRNRSRPYSILEYVDGRDLRRHLDRSGPLPMEEVQRLGLQICTALSYLHAHRIAHLDLKPENLMLSAGGDIRLIDFGLARRLDEGDTLGADFRMPRGTPAYAPPETLAGEVVGAHSDIYSLGLVFYEMLTGRLPFERSARLRTVRKRLNRPPAPPRRYRTDLTPQWQELILTTLERRPEQRFKTVADLAEALKHPEELAVTERGRAKGRLQGWGPPLGLGRRRHTRRAKPHRGTTTTKQRRPQILGAIVDGDVSDAVIERVRREALINGGTVTLLTVVAPRADNQFTRYDAATRGTVFKRRLDRYVARLRQYAIDPTVRICRGEAAAEILRVALDLPAHRLILGASRRKGMKRVLRGRLGKRLARQAPCPVIVVDADIQPAEVKLPAPGTPLSTDDLVEIDLFLLDNWVAHLSWMADWIRDTLTEGGADPRLSDAPCELGRWIDDLTAHPDWSHLGQQIAAPHTAFHATAARLAEAAERKEMTRMHRLYRDEALPLSCAIRDGLQTVSTALHRPGAPEGKPSTEPLASMEAIHAYFCHHPIGSPESDLLGLGKEAG